MGSNKIEEIIGKRFGRLTVLEKLTKANDKCHDVKYKVKCDCGKTKEVWKGSLISGLTKSCGCLSREISSEIGKRHRSDQVGKKYGRLTVLEFAGNKGKYNRVVWKCECECGNITYVETSNLTSGHTTSCGCYSKDRLSAMSRTHGMSHIRIYNIWCNMRLRCNNKNASNYLRYGGIGISVCEEWNNSFESFYEWAKHDYSDDLTIDRIEPYGNYEPTNCRWVSYREQSRNKRNTLKFTINGIEKPLCEWCDDFGLDYALVNCRRQRGWDARDLFNPIGVKRKYKMSEENKKILSLAI